MKKIFVPLLSLILLGAGCLGGSSKTSSAPDGGVFKTLNAGQEWNQFVLVPTSKGIGSLATTNILDLEMDPQDSNVLYASTRNNGMLYTEDGGVSWRQPRHTLISEGNVYDVEVDPKSVCTVYVATPKRVVRSQDCLRTLETELYLETREDVSVSHVSVDWFDTRVLWVALSNGDLLKSENRGERWKTIHSFNRPISEVLISNTDSRSVLVSTDSGIFKTADGGESWSILEFPAEAKKAKFVWQLVQNPQSTLVIAATQNGLLRSNNFGQTWEVIQLITSPGDVSIQAVAIDPVDERILYYAVPGTFYLSTDGGVTWQTQQFPSLRNASRILIDPTDRNVLYIGVAYPLK